MHDERSECVVAGQRITSSDILQIKGHPLGDPGTCGCGAFVALPRKQRPARAGDVNLHYLRIRRIPTERRQAHRRIAGDWYWVRTGRQRRSH